MTDHETEAWIADGLRYGAQMFWNGKTPKADPDTQAFKARIDALGEPSTYTDPTRDTLTPGQYTITLADGQGLSMTGGTTVVGASSDNWEFVATPRRLLPDPLGQLEPLPRRLLRRHPQL